MRSLRSLVDKSWRHPNQLFCISRNNNLILFEKILLAVLKLSSFYFVQIHTLRPHFLLMLDEMASKAVNQIEAFVIKCQKIYAHVHYLTVLVILLYFVNAFENFKYFHFLSNLIIKIYLSIYRDERCKIINWSSIFYSQCIES